MFHLLWTSNVNPRFSFYSWLQASNNSNWNLVTCQPALIFREFSRISFATRISVNFREETRSFAKCWAWRSTLNLQSAGQQGSQAGRAELAEIAVELARETDGAGDARQPRAHQVVQITLEPLSPLREIQKENLPHGSLGRTIFYRFWQSSANKWLNSY